LKVNTYKLLSIIICFSLLFTTPIYTYANTSLPDSITIQQALDKAYKNNPDLRKASLNVEKAALSRDDAAKTVTWIPEGGLVIPAYQQVMNNYQQAEIGYQVAKKAEETARDSITYTVVNAYCDALTNYNTMELNRLRLEDAKIQLTMNSVARAVGTLAEFDYEKAKAGTEQLEKAYELAKAQYNSSIAALRSLLGESENWQPELISKPILTQYNRRDLNTEISRGLSESIDVWNKEAQLKNQENQQSWVIPGLSSEMQNINLEMAKVDYEKSKRDTRTSIEQLYYLLDTMEGQIATAQQAYETASRDWQIAELKYELGMIAQSALSSIKTAELNARINLDNAKVAIAQIKAQYALLTGQEPYNPADWTDIEAPVANANEK
jgi:outer membrane protein TolC